MMNFLKLSKRNWGFLIPIPYGLIFLCLLIRNAGPYAYVFGDETKYSEWARLLPFSYSEVPSYIYLLIFKITSYCGDAFLQGARILNTAFFCGSGFFIFKIARKIAPRAIAHVLVILVLISPLNIYTLYFMPESMYIFAFWVFTWYFLDLNVQDSIYKWATAGIIFGFLSLVKPHAFFLVPSILAYYIFLLYQCSRLKSCQSWKNILSFSIIFLIFKFLVGYILAGYSGITLFGGLYQNIAMGAVSPIISNFIGYFQTSLSIFQGHVFVLLILNGVPIYLISLVLADWESAIKSTYQGKLFVYTIIVILNMLLVTTLFSAKIATNEIESGRLHLRYYNFALPLLFICMASIGGAKFELRKKMLVALPILGLMICAFFFDSAIYRSNFVDCPEFASINLGLIKIVLILVFANQILCLYETRFASKSFFLLFCPALFLYSFLNTNIHLNQLKKPNDYIRAGIFAKNNLSEHEKNNLMIVGDHILPLMHTKMIIDNPNVTLQVTENEKREFAIDEAKKLSDSILLIGNHSIKCPEFHVINLPGFKYYKKNQGIFLDFKSPLDSFLVLSTSGLSSHEGWGTWSLGSEVVFEFSANIPSDFRLNLVAHAFTNNTNKDIYIQAGDTREKLHLTTKVTTNSIVFQNVKQSNIIKFYVPCPTSPQEIGMSNDNRKIGIGFISLSIEPCKR